MSFAVLQKSSSSAVTLAFPEPIPNCGPSSSRRGPSSPLCGSVPKALSHRSLNTEVFYLNRDECGVAIYEYAPMDPKYWKYDMANSEYGREFLEELPKLEFQSRCQQQLMASCPATLKSCIGKIATL